MKTRIVALVVGTNVLTGALVYLSLSRDAPSGQVEESGDRPSVVDSEFRSKENSPDQSRRPGVFGSVATEEMLRELKQVEDNISIMYLADQYADRLDGKAVEEAVGDWLELEASKRQTIVLKSLYRRWSEIDPHRAADSVMNLNWEGHTYSVRETAFKLGGEKTQYEHTVDSLKWWQDLVRFPFKAIAVEDPAAALELMEGNLDAFPVGGYAGGNTNFSEIGKQLAQEGELDKIRIWGVGLNTLEEEKVYQLVYSFYHSVGIGLANLETESAWAFFDELDSEANFERASRGYVTERARAHPQEMADWVLGLDTDRDALLYGVMMQWARKENGLENALDFLARVPGEIDKDPLVERLFSGVPKDDYETELSLIDLIENPDTRDRRTSLFLTRSQDLPHRSRFELAQTIQNQKRREVPTGSILLSWVKDDPEGAFQALESLSDYDDAFIDKIRGDMLESSEEAAGRSEE